ncbi:MAG: VCBS repeat-containing protein [bacterium]
MVLRNLIVTLLVCAVVPARAGGLPASTFFGGAGSDDASAIARAADGSVFIAGTTSSTNLPTHAGAFDAIANGGSDVFIAKFDGGLSNLLAATFLGGALDDGARALAIDAAGRIVVAGTTFSTNFPTSPAAQDATYGGAGDAFVAVFDAGLSNLLASTFLGGLGNDDAFALAADDATNVYVAGVTGSTNFPTAGAPPFDATHNSARDAFVSRLNANLSVLSASTFLGGNGLDQAFALQWDPVGQIVVAGATASTNFPTSAGAYDTTRNSANDLFAARLSADLTGLAASTYVGPADSIGAAGLGLDTSGRVYVACRTSVAGYPVTAGAFDTTANGGADIGVSLLSSDLSTLVASTLLGGSSEDSLYSLIVEDGGTVCVAGSSRSPDFPVTPGPVDGRYAGTVFNTDAVASRFNSSLTALLASTCLRGNGGDDTARALSADGAGGVYIAGGTAAVDFPVTPWAYDSSFNGMVDAFAGKLTLTHDNMQGVDFDGDGRTDPVVFDTARLIWYLLRTSSGFLEQQFGFGGVIPVQGDYDGDGRLDFAVYAPSSGNWHISRTTAGFLIRQFGFGSVTPVPADYDGDGKTDVAVYDRWSGTWYIFRTTEGFLIRQFGFGSVIPVPADYDEDGKADIAVFDPSMGDWYLLRSRAGFTIAQFGFNGVTPVPADYDGDGQADIAVYHRASANWYLLQSRAGFKTRPFGLGSVVPVPSDYDGDSHADIGVYDLTSGYWRLLESRVGNEAVQFGYSGAVPILNQYWINRAFGFP